MPADGRIDALFAVPAEEFVAARDALVKELKAAGDKDTAADVKALRRPTVAAWAVNQVARTSKKDVAELLRVGDRLRDAHEALLAGEGDAAVREVTAERRRLVAQLTKQAAALLGAGGQAQVEAITHTFDAAVADPDAGLAVRSGRLSKELEAPSGFGGGLVFGSSEPAAPAAPKAEGGTETAAAGAEARAKAEELERRRRELEQDAGDRTAEAEDAERDAAAAHQEVDRLRELLAAAEERARSTAGKAERARAAASAAQDAVPELGAD